MKENSLLEILRKTDLEIQRAASVKLDKNWGFQTKGAAHTRLYFISGGSGFLKTDKQYVEMTPEKVYLIPVNCKFSCGCEYLEKIFFHVNVSTVEKYDLFFNVDKICALPFPSEDFKKMKDLLASERYVDMLELKMILLKVLIEFYTAFSFPTVKAKKYSRLIENVITFIDENISIKLTVSDISKSLFISESKLRNAFKKEMNMPIGKYIDDMIFIKAKQMLSNSQNSIAAVSTELGFCDQFYFSRRFKEKFDFTPSHFRKVNKIY